MTNKKYVPAGPLTINRYFTNIEDNVYSSIEWEERTAVINNSKGEVIFQQDKVKVPKDWSMTATNIVASKYFYGKRNSSERETGIDQLVKRVVDTITRFGINNDYFTQETSNIFGDELAWLLLHQYGAFNSPVWFNVGCDLYEPDAKAGSWHFVKETSTSKILYERSGYKYPQCSACFINSIEDSMEGIMRLATTEAILFKHGSGTGTNFSALRSSKESVSGGGTASGPLSFMKGLDAFAGVIKSGGKCLAPHQKIYTNLGPKPVQELAESGLSFVVLSYDPPSGRYKAKEATAWKSGEKEVVRVLTDKGQFDVSFDHPFRLPDGTFINAVNLTPGKSLLACTIDESEGYLRVGLRDGNKGKEFLHRLIETDILGWDMEGYSSHHKDENKLNNALDNLERLTQAEHASLHEKELISLGIHPFQLQSYPHSGKDNGMHSSSPFWNSEKAEEYKQGQRNILKESGRAKEIQKLSSIQKMLNTGYSLINAGFDISSFSKYAKARKVSFGKIGSISKVLNSITKYFGTYENYLGQIAENNHKVLSVTSLGVQSVYSVEVKCSTLDDKSPESGHNFVIWSGNSLTGSGVVVSNTRRAAKMAILNVNHPDILEFIDCKVKEDKKAQALMREGYDGTSGPDSEAYASVFYQNANNSVRVTDKFMNAVENNLKFDTVSVIGNKAVETLNAADVMSKIATAAWNCGDPGMQFDDITNKWHTVSNTAKINASNPCQPGFATILTPSGIRMFDDINVGSVVWSGLNWTKVIRKISTGIKPVFKYKTTAGSFIGTEEHKVVSDGIKIEIRNTNSIDRNSGPFTSSLSKLDLKGYEQTIMDGLVLGDGTVKTCNKKEDGSSNSYTLLYIGENDQAYFKSEVKNFIFFLPAFDRTAYKVKTTLTNEEIPYTYNRKIPDRFYKGDSTIVRAFLRGLYSANGSICGNRITLKATSFSIIEQVQNMLSSIGISSYYTKNLSKEVEFSNGTYTCKDSYDLNITKDRLRFAYLIGFIQLDKTNKLDSLCLYTNDSNNKKTNYPIFEIEELGNVEVFDIEVEAVEHTYWTGGLLVSNCSEFVFLDDTACNLASLNLLKFLRTGNTFDVESFRQAVSIFTIAQDILVDMSGYPTEAIARNSHDYRPLGLGYANLGSLLLASGIAYDSDQGRAIAAIITAIMTGQSYLTSAQLAEKMPALYNAGVGRDYIEKYDDMVSKFGFASGACPGWFINKVPFEYVMRLHRDSIDAIDFDLLPDKNLADEAYYVWKEAIRIGSKFGFRNCQTTVLAPCGCLTQNSLVSTDKGLLRLVSLGDKSGNQWQDINYNVYTPDNVDKASMFYINGKANTRKITTESGYVLQGTDNHRIKVLDNNTKEWYWKRLDEITNQDIVPIALKSMIGLPQEIELPLLEELYKSSNKDTTSPTKMSAELAELVGYFMGDGSLHEKGLRFSITNEDIEVENRIKYLCYQLFNIECKIDKSTECHSVDLHSTHIMRWWIDCGFSKVKPEETHIGKGYIPFIPDKILQSNDSLIYGAFLRGLFEADGTVSDGNPTLSSSYREFVSEIQSLLLSLEIPSTIKEDNSVRLGGTNYIIRIKNLDYNKKFVSKIRFISKRKNDKVVLECKQTPKGDLIYIEDSLFTELYGNKNTKQKISARSSLARTNGIPRNSISKMDPDKKNVNLQRALRFFYDKVKDNEDGGIQDTYDVSVPKSVTYTANGFISHNTIGFMMDCNTTGIEPELGLIKYKKMVGGGQLKIVNDTVESALTTLGYDTATIDSILKYIEENGTVEGSALHNKDLPIFDTSFKPNNGTRSIKYEGHIDMMAAVQPFISGAISKTVNLPNEATVTDIEEAYIRAWRSGLKAVAIYRDGSKSNQVLVTSKETISTKTSKPPAQDLLKTAGHLKEVGVSLDEAVWTLEQVYGVDLSDTVDIQVSLEQDKLGPPASVRHKLPDTRPAINHKFSIIGHEGYLNVGLYESGQPGEIFITMAKEGSTLSGFMDSFAMVFSVALQHGVPLETLVNKLAHTHFEPSGWTSNPDIGYAKSIMDYLARWLEKKFLNKTAPEELEKDLVPIEAYEEPVSIKNSLGDAPFCSNCGSMMVRKSSCYYCPECGESNGCS